VELATRVEFSSTRVEFSSTRVDKKKVDNNNDDEDEEKKQKLSEMKQMSPRDLWKADLVNFLEAFDKLEKKEESIAKVIHWLWKIIKRCLLLIYHPISYNFH